MKSIFVSVACVFLSVPAAAQEYADTVGDSYKITLKRTSESKTDDGSSSSSSVSHAYVEHIDAVGPEGTQRTFDVSLDEGEERHSANWQFPARVLEAPDGALSLLNREELEERRDAWLEEAEIPAEACGIWYFTWNAFQIECDPDAILDTIRAIRIQPRVLAEDADYSAPMALAPSRLTESSKGDEGATYSAVMGVDPDAVRKGEAQTKVVVGEIMKEPISFEAAYADLADEEISGTIAVTLQADTQGRVWRRSTATEIETLKPGGVAEQSTSIEVIERLPLEN